MAFPIIGAAIAGAQLLGGIAGQNQQRNIARDIDRIGKEQAGLFLNIPLPSIEDQELSLEELQLLGEYNPEMLEALSLGPSAMEEIALDPRLQEAEMGALEALADISEEGVTPGAIARLEQARRSADAANTARQEAILQNMQQRGISGSGAELASRLSAAQQASDSQNQAALDLMRQMEDRSYQATMDRGQLASALEQQDFSQQSDVARARDIINQFNMQNRQRVSDQNVAERNRAQAANLAARQTVADQNVQLRNQQQQYNKELQQQLFQNRLAQAQGAAGGKQTQAGGAEAYLQSGQAGKKDSAIGSGVGNLLGGLFG